MISKVVVQIYKPQGSSDWDKMHIVRCTSAALCANLKISKHFYKNATQSQKVVTDRTHAFWMLVWQKATCTDAALSNISLLTN